jgi:hypothetical protein
VPTLATTCQEKDKAAHRQQLAFAVAQAATDTAALETHEVHDFILCNYLTSCKIDAFFDADVQHCNVCWSKCHGGILPALCWYSRHDCEHAGAAENFKAESPITLRQLHMKAQSAHFKSNGGTGNPGPSLRIEGQLGNL